MLFAIRAAAAVVSLGLSWLVTVGLLFGFVAMLYEAGWYVWSIASGPLHELLDEIDIGLSVTPVAPSWQWPDPEWLLHITGWAALLGVGVQLALYLLTPMRWQLRQVVGALPMSRLRTDTVPGELFDQVRRRAGLIQPTSLWVVETDRILAFALGRPFGGAVVVSRGLLQTLPDWGAKWVMAHELGHIRHRDSLLGAFWLIGVRGQELVMRLQLRLLDWLLAPLRLSRLAIWVFLWPLMILVWCLLKASRVGQAVARGVWLLVDRWASRRIEYRADRRAAEWVGATEGIRVLGALGGDAEPLFNGLFATHPKISSRIAALERLV